MTLERLGEIIRIGGASAGEAFIISAFMAVGCEAIVKRENEYRAEYGSRIIEQAKSLRAEFNTPPSIQELEDLL